MNTEHTFAGLQIVGDEIEPATIETVLGIKPTVAYRRGESYRPSPKSRHLVKGHTGVFYFHTDENYSDSLNEHLRLLIRLLFPEWQNGQTDLLITRIGEIKRLIAIQKAHAVVSCFWHGPENSTPIIDEKYRNFFTDVMGFEIETDFVSEEPVRARVFA
jgi:hypothetical protein